MKYSNKALFVEISAVLRYLASNFFMKITSILLLPIIQRRLGIATYGLWMNFNQIITLFLRVSTLNVGVNLRRALPQNKHERSVLLSSLASLILILSLTVSLALVVSREYWAILFFGDKNYKGLVLFMAITIPVSVVINEAHNYLIGLKKHRLVANSTAIRYLVRLLIFIALALTISSVSVLILAYLFLEICYLLFIISSFRNILDDIDLSWQRIDAGLIKEKVKYSVPLFIGSIGIWLSSYGDRFLILRFMDTEKLGLYSALYTLASPILLLINPLANVVVPSFSFKEGNNNDDVRALYYLIFLIGLIVVGYGFIFFFGRFYLNIFLDYSLSPEIVKVFGELFVGMCFFTLASVQSALLTAKATKAHHGYYWLLVSVLSLLMNWFLIPYFGLRAASISTLLCYEFLVFLFFILLKDFIKLWGVFVVIMMIVIILTIVGFN